MPFFLRAFLRAPSRVGAIAPSGAALARLITSRIRRDSGPVIELGPGTGVFTRALVASGIPEGDLVLVEQGGEFAEALRSRFPAAQVLAVDAAKLRGLELLDGRKAGSAISGLPLRAMSPREIMAILKATFDHLRPDAGFYQFTYALRCPVPRPILDRLGLEAVRVGTALANIPPASVYLIRRRVPRRAPAIVSQRQHFSSPLS
jgi:phospholipid N-methyltransferase